MQNTYRIDTTRLKIAMVLKGLNLTQLAQKAGVSRNTVSNIFKGKLPSCPTILKIASALSLSDEEAQSIFFTRDLREM